MRRKKLVGDSASPYEVLTNPPGKFRFSQASGSERHHGGDGFQGIGCQFEVVEREE